MTSAKSAAAVHAAKARAAMDSVVCSAGCVVVMFAALSGHPVVMKHVVKMDHALMTTQCAAILIEDRRSAAMTASRKIADSAAKTT